MALASGHEAAGLEGEELARQEQHYEGFTQGLSRLTPGRWLFPTAFTRYADKIYNFQWHGDDVVVMGCPRTGTSWLMEAVWTIRHNPDLDNPLAQTPILARTPYIDMDMMLDGVKMPPLTPDNPLLQGFLALCPGGDPNQGVSVQVCRAIPPPRTIKTHLPLSLLHPTLLDTAKVVYVARNPRDVVASLHHHCSVLNTLNYRGSVQEFVKMFVDDEAVLGPYWQHVQEAWAKRRHPRLHFVFYEDLKADTKAELRKLDEFLGCGLTDAQIDNVAQHTSFAQMQSRDNLMGMKSADNPMMNQEIVKRDGGFFRKGAVGSWKNKLTEQMVEQLDQWVQKHLSDVPFKYTI